MRVAPKGEFSFPENENSMVRVTKWTGRDSIQNVRIKPQVVTLGDTPNLEIEVEGEGDLHRFDKIACLSILSTSIPPGLSPLLPQTGSTGRTEPMTLIEGGSGSPLLCSIRKVSRRDLFWGSILCMRPYLPLIALCGLALFE